MNDSVIYELRASDLPSVKDYPVIPLNPVSINLNVFLYFLR